MAVPLGLLQTRLGYGKQGDEAAASRASGPRPRSPKAMRNARSRHLIRDFRKFDSLYRPSRFDMLNVRPLP